jgi:hypothetical protein
MKGVSRYSDRRFEAETQFGILAPILVDFSRFAVIRVDFQGLLARQTLLPIFMILTLCDVHHKAPSWVEAFDRLVRQCFLGKLNPGDIEPMSGLVTTRVDLRLLCPPLFHSFLRKFALSFSFCVGPFPCVQTLLPAGRIPNSLAGLSRDPRPTLAHKNCLRFGKSSAMTRDGVSLSLRAWNLALLKNGEKT